MTLIRLICLLACLVIHSSMDPFPQNISNNCHIGLRAETHAFALHHYPPHSDTWQKMERLLVKAKANRAIFFVADPGVFAGVSRRVTKMLGAVGIEVLVTSIYQTLIEEYNPGRDLLIDLVIDLQIAKLHPEWEDAIPIPPQEYHLHNRVIIQSEQLNGRFRSDVLPFLHACHSSPTCVIWEYSDYNYKLLKEESEAYLSAIVLPVMFQDLDPVHPLPLAQRTMDHFGAGSLIGHRRWDFNQLVVRYGKEHHLSGGYGLNSHADALASGHQHTRVCICAHVESSPSPGEYHRLSDVVRYGCVPVFERFADVLWVRSLSECGNVHFAPTMEDVVYIAHMVSTNITAATEEWQTSIDHSLEWWSHQLEEINFILKDLFFPGPPERSFRGFRV